ncbi:hypothetical protein GCM10027612_05350 [Microbispora bryophytorum subsp. camponoti]
MVDHLDPGTTIKRRIEVSNTSGHRMRVSLYPAAADIRGHAFVFAPDRSANELTSWTSIAPTEIDLAPGRPAGPGSPPACRPTRGRASGTG